MMTNALLHNGVRNHNHRFWKWVSGVLGVLLVSAIVGLIGTIKKVERLETIEESLVKEVEHLRTTQELMAKAVNKMQATEELRGKEVDKNTQWIRDWYNELRVPERDQRQDSAIEELTRRLTALEER